MNAKLKLRSGQEITVPVVRKNVKTIWVKLDSGRIIKRHIIKHAVEFV